MFHLRKKYKSRKKWYNVYIHPLGITATIYIFPHKKFISDYETPLHIFSEQSYTELDIGKIWGEGYQA